MLPADQNTSASDFIRAAIGVLEKGHFSSPAPNEACVVVFDSAAWTPFIGSAEQLLSAPECARSARLRFARDRSTYVLAHAWWRVMLGISLDLDPTEVPLSSSAAGQPLLLGTGFSTSLSHSGTWVAMAVGGGATVGVDIECSPPHTPLSALMPDICTPDEIAGLEILSPPHRETALLALWTRKEALLKAFGVGLGADPSHLSARTDGLAMPPPLTTESHQIPCRVANLELPIGVVGAVAMPASTAIVRLCALEDI
ncbi:4'-phosphopantetheinyl transferase superfamily protein [Rhodanobacter sp. TND4FH1]